MTKEQCLSMFKRRSEDLDNTTYFYLKNLYFEREWTKERAMHELEQLNKRPLFNALTYWWPIKEVLRIYAGEEDGTAAEE